MHIIFQNNYAEAREMIIDTFLSANTANGFVSLYGDFLKGKKQYIIKGGPGTGKSTMMKNIGAFAENEGEDVEYIRCSSDPDSLDGVWLKARNIAVCDGTAPHIIEPENVGCMGGIIGLTECWDEKSLSEATEEILTVKARTANAYRSAYGYLEAAGKIFETTFASAVEASGDTIKKTASEFCGTFLKKKKKKPDPTDETRFISTFSHKGATAYYGTVETLADRILTLPYACGAADLAIEEIRDEAKSKGYGTIGFSDPMLPKHLMGAVFPSERLAVIAFNPAFESEEDREYDAFRGSYLTDITDGAADGVYGMLFEQATDRFKTAKAHHDVLERIFIKNMDFEKVGRITASLMTRIFSE